MSDIIKKESIQDKCKIRDKQAQIILEIIELAKGLKFCTVELANKIRYPNHIREDDIEAIRKKLDYTFWCQCFDEYQVEKFLTTTDKEKLFDKMEKDTPVFNFENVMNTINGFMNSKDATATTMIKKIYEEITDAVFRVGNKNQQKNEKRLQLGIPKSFRLSIFYVYSPGLPAYVSSNNSRFNLIDDFERACYLVDGKVQPDRQKNIRSLTDSVLRKEERFVDSPYFIMQIFKNGNVKLTMKSLVVLKRFNHWGLKGNRLA